MKGPGKGLGEASKCKECDLREERVVKAGEGLGEASKCNRSVT